MVDGKEDLHATWSTVFLLLNADRALNCRPEPGLRVDGEHRLCESDKCSCLMGFNKLGNTFRLWVTTTSSLESTEEFRD